MIVGIHQPNYLPWIGYFVKIARSDRFILLDDAQYARGGFINRNRIKTPRGPEWLTVPVRSAGRLAVPIGEIVPCHDTPWARTHLRTIETNYRRAPHYAEVMDSLLRPVLEAPREAAVWASLASLNTELIRRICAGLGIDTPLVKASTIGVPSRGTRRLVDLVQSVGGTAYLSGRGGDRYQDAHAFAGAGIELLYNDFDPPRYPQLWGAFEPNLSIIDYLMCCGPSAARDFVTAAAGTAGARAAFAAQGI